MFQNNPQEINSGQNQANVHPDILKCTAFDFDIGAYFHACLLHFFSFIILGPLIVLYTPLLSCITGARYLCYNFLFSRFYQQFYS
jgi:hypothetical protein